MLMTEIQRRIEAQRTRTKVGGPSEQTTSFKTLLLGGTCLVPALLTASPAALAEGGIKLGLGGYMNNFFSAGDIDADDGTDFNPTGLFSDGEIFFFGESKLDNGLTFGAQIELESQQESPDQIDENFGYVEGGFGRFQFGSENTAPYLMHFSAPSVGSLVNTGWVTVFVPQPAGHSAGFRTPGLSTYLDIGNDENTLTYFTPRLYGFQIGVSYQPSVVFSGDGKNFPVEANRDTEYHNGFGLGVNFVESFGGVDVALAGGFRFAQAPDDDIVALDPGVTATHNDGRVFTIGRDDVMQWSGGFNIGYAGFTLGGSVAAETEGRVVPSTSAFTSSSAFVGGAVAASLVAPAFAAPFSTIQTNGITSFTSSAVSSEGYSWDLGLAYETGPWRFGGIWFYGEEEGDVLIGDNNSLQAAQASVEYAVGPGITASLSALYAAWGTENGNDTDGIVGIAGVAFSF